MTLTQSGFAKYLGWGQLVITYLNSILDGQPIPSTRSGWVKLLTSALVAWSIHHAANTSAHNPTGAK